MPLPANTVIQCALTPDELPGFVAKQLGYLYLKRYNPSPALLAIKRFKQGACKGCLVWALTDEGKVLGWALRAITEGRTAADVMVFVRPEFRRLGIADALLDCCVHFGPKVAVAYYPHDETAKAFYKFREKKREGKRGI